MMHDGECCQQPKWEPRICVIDYGFLDATPTALMPAEKDCPGDRIKILPSGRPRKLSKNGVDGSLNWTQLMLHKGLIPTLELCEYYMGLPIKWSALEPLETHKFQQWLEQHGSY
jgi:hypothetical protein